MRFFDFIKKVVKAVDRKIKKIRRSDDRTKRNWLIGSTVVAMIVIVFIWTAYLNITIPQVGQQPAAEAPSSEVQVEEEPSGNSIFSVFTRGFRITAKSISKNVNSIVDKIKNTVDEAKDRFNNVREYSPDDSDSPFVSPDAATSSINNQ